MVYLKKIKTVQYPETLAPVNVIRGTSREKIY